MEQWREDLYENCLTHHGVVGMHWGVRRYRNYDGTLTSSGRKRYGVGEKKAVSKSLKLDKKKRDVKAAKKEADKAKKEAKEAASELKKEREALAAEKANAAKMSNEELRLTVERLRLEQEYYKLTHPEKTPSKSAIKKSEDNLNYIKTVALTGTSVVGLIAAIKKLKEKSGD